MNSTSSLISPNTQSRPALLMGGMPAISGPPEATASLSTC